MRSETRYRLAYLLALVLGTPMLATSFHVETATAGSPPTGEITQISVQEWNEYRDAVVNGANVRCVYDARRQMTCDLESDSVVWTFTSFGHPAHPGVVRRKLVVGTGLMGIERSGQFAGDKRAFEIWYDEFRAYDERQLELWAEEFKRRPQ